MGCGACCGAVCISWPTGWEVQGWLLLHVTLEPWQAHAVFTSLFTSPMCVTAGGGNSGFGEFWPDPTDYQRTQTNHPPPSRPAAV